MLVLVILFKFPGFFFSAGWYDFKVMLLLLLLTWGCGAKKIVSILGCWLLSSDQYCRNFNFEAHVTFKFLSEMRGLFYYMCGFRL